MTDNYMTLKELHDIIEDLMVNEDRGSDKIWLQSDPTEAPTELTGIFIPQAAGEIYLESIEWK